MRGWRRIAGTERTDSAGRRLVQVRHAARQQTAWWRIGTDVIMQVRDIADGDRLPACYGIVGRDMARASRV